MQTSQRRCTAGVTPYRPFHDGCIYPHAALEESTLRPRWSWPTRANLVSRNTQDADDGVVARHFEQPLTRTVWDVPRGCGAGVQTPSETLDFSWEQRYLAAPHPPFSNSAASLPHHTDSSLRWRGGKEPRLPKKVCLMS